MTGPVDGPLVYPVSLHDFRAAVLEASQRRPVLVDFWAEWCAPCILIAPTLEQLVRDYGGRLRLAKLEVDRGDNMKLAGRYRVRGFPTVILFEQGAERGRFSGNRPLGRIRKFISENSLLLSQDSDGDPQDVA